MGAELARARAGEKTQTGMKESQLRDFAKGPVGKGQAVKPLNMMNLMTSAEEKGEPKLSKKANRKEEAKEKKVGKGSDYGPSPMTSMSDTATGGLKKVGTGQTGKMTKTAGRKKFVGKGQSGPTMPPPPPGLMGGGGAMPAAPPPMLGAMGGGGPMPGGGGVLPGMPPTPPPAPKPAMPPMGPPPPSGARSAVPPAKKSPTRPKSTTAGSGSPANKRTLRSSGKIR